jgi:hypothetical protein
MLNAKLRKVAAPVGEYFLKVLHMSFTARHLNPLEEL